MRGRFVRTPALPTSPGIDSVGVVEARGAGVDGPKMGTRVVLLDVWANWHELVIASAERVIPVPDALSDHDAAQAMINPVTALVLTTVEHRLRPGEWLAQTAAGSTVGRLALQLARSEGFRTLNLVRRSAQVAEIAALGGDLTWCTEDADWPAQFAPPKAAGSKRRSIAWAVGSARPWREDCSPAPPLSSGRRPSRCSFQFCARSRPSVQARALAFGRRASPGRRAGSRIGPRRLRDGRSTAARYRARHKANVAAD
jgi:hypothetical protein